MKKHNFDKSTHIQGYYIPHKICDDLVKLFKRIKHRQAAGLTGYGVNKEAKDSIDVILNYGDTGLDPYTEKLQKCVEDYEKCYQGLHSVGRYAPDVEGVIFNIINQVEVLKIGILKDRVC